jgi:hypothetical protein
MKPDIIEPDLNILRKYLNIYSNLIFNQCPASFINVLENIGKKLLLTANQMCSGAILKQSNG